MKTGEMEAMKLSIDELERIVRQAGKMLRSAHVSAEDVGQKQGDANFVTGYDVRIQRFLPSSIQSWAVEGSD